MRFKKPKSFKGPSEAQTQKAGFAQMRWMIAQDPRWKLVVGLPMEAPYQGMEEKKRYAWLNHLKAMGQPKDFPDIFVFYQNAMYGGLAIELKKAGKGLRPGQQDWLKLLNFNGYCSVGLSTDNAQDIIKVIQLYFDDKLVLDEKTGSILQ